MDADFDRRGGRARRGGSRDAGTCGCLGARRAGVLGAGRALQPPGRPARTHAASPGGGPGLRARAGRRGRAPRDHGAAAARGQSPAAHGELHGARHADGEAAAHARRLPRAARLPHRARRRHGHCAARAACAHPPRRVHLRPRPQRLPRRPHRRTRRTARYGLPGGRGRRRLQSAGARSRTRRRSRRLPSGRQHRLLRAAGLRLRGALRGLERQRPLRPARSHGPDLRRALPGLQRQRPLGRQPDRRRRRRALLHRVADPVGARAIVVSNGQRTIAVEVVDQEGLFNTSPGADPPARRRGGYQLDGVFISATHDESAPDTLGISGRRHDLERQRVLRGLPGGAVRPGDRAGLPRDAPGVRSLRRSHGAGQPAPVLVLVPLRGRPADAGAPGGRTERADDRDDGDVCQHAETLAFNSGTPG